MTDLPSAIAALPFVTSKLGVATRLWDVTPTSDWSADNARGRDYADAAIACMVEHQAPTLLPNIVKAIRLSDSPWTGLEVGFFQRIAERLS